MEKRFIKIIKEICKEEKIDLEIFSMDWIFKLLKNNKYGYIIGYDFGLTNCATHAICSDKSATSDILTSFGIPNVEHTFFSEPSLAKDISVNGNWNSLIGLLQKYGELVCKANMGSSGKQVFHVTNQAELEMATFKIFQKSDAMAVCPYYDIKNEYRVIILDGKIKLVYVKNRPFLVGDGQHTLEYLLCKKLENEKIDINLSEEDLKIVLDNNEKFEIGWKHNLSNGAKAEIINDSELIEKLSKIALEAAKKINIRFASVDIIECADGFKILEINSGVMMEFFASQNEKFYNIAKSIYKEAILKMFE